MKKIFYFVIPIVLCACSLTGGSEPSRFFAMQSMSGQNIITAPKRINVRVAPVQIPQSMDRLQMVTAVKNTPEIKIHEFARWVESPDDAITNVIAENITRYAKNVTARATSVNSMKTPDYTLSVDVVNFQTEVDGYITLDAWWTVKNKNNKIVAERHTILTEPTPKIDDNNFADVVDTQSLLVSKLSEKIATDIIKLAK